MFFKFFDLSFIGKILKKFKNNNEKIEYGKVEFLPDEIQHLSFKQYNIKQTYLVKN